MAAIPVKARYTHLSWGTGSACPEPCAPTVYHEGRECLKNVNLEGSCGSQVGAFLRISFMLKALMDIPGDGVFTLTMEGSRMSLQLSMVGLMVEDMPVSLQFYRRLGLDLPEEEDAKPFVMLRMESGVTIFWDTVFAKTYDPTRELPSGGYRVMLEFFLEDTAAVDAKYAELVSFGYHGRSAPIQTNGPYAAMVEDPDGNCILITNDSDTAS
jgi:predicted lactoylglutathione lyase